MVGCQAPKREGVTQPGKGKAPELSTLPSFPCASRCLMRNIWWQMMFSDLKLLPKETRGIFIYRLTKSAGKTMLTPTWNMGNVYPFNHCSTDSSLRLVQFPLFVALKWLQWFSSPVNTTASQLQYLLLGWLNTLTAMQAAPFWPAGHGFLSSSLPRTRKLCGRELICTHWDKRRQGPQKWEICLNEYKLNEKATKISIGRNADPVSVLYL